MAMKPGNFPLHPVRLAISAALLFAFACGAHAQVPFAPLADGAALPSALAQQLQAVSTRDIGRAPQPATDSLKAVPDAQPVSGKPHVLYMGAEYCPYCAVVRWPLVMALMRFGSFTGLTVTRSSATDVAANTPTLSFVHADYTSRWLDFNAVETSDREQRPLQKPTAAQLEKITRFDRKPYTNYPGSIPFLDIADRWIMVGSPINPSLLQGLDWFEVVARLDTGKGPLWAAMLGQADRLTRALCELTRDEPRTACAPLGSGSGTRDK